MSMRIPRWPAAAAAVAALLLLPGVAPSPTTDAGIARAQTPSVGTTDTYVRDVRRLTDALFAFGTSFQSVRSAADLDPRIDEARTRLAAFREAADALDAYRLERPKLERQRSLLVGAAGPVADTSDDLLDALEARDLRAVRVAREATAAALVDMTRASRGRPPAATIPAA